MKLHNTSIKQNASEIMETNSLKPIEFTSDDKIIPTIGIMPRINIVKQAVGYNGTTSVCYTTPTDKDFYLTNLSFNFGNDYLTSTGIAGYVTFTTREGETINFNVGEVAEPASTEFIFSHDIQFPFRGVLLAKGSNVSITPINNTHGNILICGYTHSDRSGL